MPPARDEILRWVVEHVGPTRVGRDLGIDRVRSLDDLRAAVPVRDEEPHELDVEARLGFGVIDGADPHAAALVGGARERAHALEVWRAKIGSVRRVAVLRGGGGDREIDRVILDDLRELGGELLRIDRCDDPRSVLDRLQRFDPELLVVPSALVCAHLEAVHRDPLELALPHVRAVLAEHDLGRPLRGRLPRRSSGWLHRAGRVGLPTLRGPDQAVTLAVASVVIELQPYTNPEDDGARVYATQTVLPEHAVVGQRYAVVLTSPLGFLRMRTGEHVRVVGFDPPTVEAPFPRPRVVRLSSPPADVRLEGCTVAGAWLTASVRQSLRREDPALVAAEIGPDPQTLPTIGSLPSSRAGGRDLFDDTELGRPTRTGAHRTALRRPRGLLCRIELQGFVARDLPRRLGQRIDRSLCAASPAYAFLRGRGELEPPRVVVVPPGTRRSEIERRIVELGGPAWMPEVRVTV